MTGRSRLFGFFVLFGANAVQVFHAHKKKSSPGNGGRWMVAIAEIIDCQDAEVRPRLNHVALARVGDTPRSAPPQARERRASYTARPSLQSMQGRSIIRASLVPHARR